MECPRHHPDGLGRPTKGQLIKPVVAMDGELAETGSLDLACERRIEELLRSSGKTGRDSGMPPPSSNGLSKPAVEEVSEKRARSLRGKSKRDPGGWPGHPGRALRQVETPGEVVDHFPGVRGHRDARLPKGIAFEVRSGRQVPRTFLRRRRSMSSSIGRVHARARTAARSRRPRFREMSPGRSGTESAWRPASPIPAASGSSRRRGSPGRFATRRTRSGKRSRSRPEHPDETGLRVAGKLHRVARSATRRRSSCGPIPRAGLQPRLPAKFDRRFDRIIAGGEKFCDDLPAFGPARAGKRGPKKRRVPENFLRRPKKRKKETLLFLHALPVPSRTTRPNGMFG